MRKQFASTVGELMGQNERVVTLLGDIGVWGFNQVFTDYPERIYNVGILEQATISMAAGLALTGFIPVVHTIAPFLVERALEQLKDDFGYQHLGGNFVSVGASYDYASLGCTHHCPADVGILSRIPGMEIIVPGTAVEFDQLFRFYYDDGNPTYFRLSERSNTESNFTEPGKAVAIQSGKQATIVCVGPTLDRVMEAATNKDVGVIYYSVVKPFDAETLRETTYSDKVLLVEPYYEGVLTSEVTRAFYPKAIKLDYMGVPHTFLHNYGNAEQHDAQINLTADAIANRLERLIHA